MISFLGTSHAAHHLALGAIKRGNEVTFNHALADVIFISEDTPTDDKGIRNLDSITELVEFGKRLDKPLILTSQVPPGFTRSLGIENIHHQAETLRIKDAEERAYSPDYIAVGGEAPFPPTYTKDLLSFKCPILRMSWESAEFSKIAVNMFLAAQVERTNLLSAAAQKMGANWGDVAKALANDKRIGHEAYLTPGRWQDSKHLMRDYRTLEAISIF